MAILSNSAVQFGRLVVFFRPSGFYLFGRPDSAVWARLIKTFTFGHFWGRPPKTPSFTDRFDLGLLAFSRIGRLFFNLSGNTVDQNLVSVCVKSKKGEAVSIYEPPLFQGIHHRYLLTTNSAVSIGTVALSTQW